MVYNIWLAYKAKNVYVKAYIFVTKHAYIHTQAHIHMHTYIYLHTHTLQSFKSFILLLKRYSYGGQKGLDSSSSAFLDMHFWEIN